MITVWTEEETTEELKDDLSGYPNWMVGGLITHARYDGH